MASAPIYCTHKEFKRVFPQLDEFDQKTPIYGWTNGLTNFSDSSIDVYYSHDTGLIDTLFWDGAKINKITYNTTRTTRVDGAFTKDATVFYVDAGHGLAANDIVKIDNEYIRVVSVSDDTITISTPSTNRGLFQTTAQAHTNDTSVYRIIDESADMGDASEAGSVDALCFVYDSDLDMCLLTTSGTSNIDPSDYLVESGEDFATMVTQFRTDASRYLDSRLDPKLPKNMWKNEAGEFDYMIIRTTALYAAAFMVKTKDPGSELATALMTEADNNVQLLNEGRAALSYQNTGDASQGIIRDVQYTAGYIRPVDLKGRAGRVDYDKIKVKITTSGNFGTCKYSVWVKDSDGLKNNLVIDNQLITGDYQTLAYGLQVRFGDTTDTDSAANNDEWEVEVRGYNEEVDTGDIKGIKMTRRRHYL